MVRRFFAVLPILVLAMALTSRTLADDDDQDDGDDSPAGQSNAKSTAPQVICCSCSSTSSAAASTSTAASSTVSSSASSSSTDASTDSSTSAVSTSSASSTASSTAVSSSEPCPCQLIQVLLNIRNTVLTVSEQSKFDGCLSKVRVILLDNKKNDKQKISKIGFGLRKCFNDNPSIGEKCKWKNIKGWGLVFDFAYTVSLLIDNEFDENEGNANADSNGNCPLFSAIVNGTANDACGSGSSAKIQDFVNKKGKKYFRHSLPNFNKGRRLGWFKKGLKKNFFYAYPALEECVENVTISNSTTVGQYMDLCDYYDKQNSMGNSVLNGSASDCVLIQSLNQGINSSANSTNSSVVAEAQQYVQNLTVQFQSVTDAPSRLGLIISSFAKLSAKCRLLLKRIQMQGIPFSCMMADIVAIGASCANGEACGNLTYGPPSASWQETCMVDPAYDLSDIEDSVNTFYNALNTSSKFAFSSFRNSITNCVRNTTLGTNYDAKLSCVKYYVSNYSNQNKGYRAALLAVEVVTVIVEYVSFAVFGTLSMLCGCS